jgi:hypothetical protein
MGRKKGDRRRLTALDAELVHQVLALNGNNKADAARRLDMSPASVFKVVKQAEEAGTDLKLARSQAASKLATKLQIGAELIFDSIKPEDLNSGQIAQYDKDGEITGYKRYGPTLVEKATAGGIMMDKATVVQRYEEALLKDEQSGVLLMPSDLQGLATAVGGKMKELTALHISFADDNEELVTNVQDVLSQLQTAEYTETDGSEAD